VTARDGLRIDHFGNQYVIHYHKASPSMAPQVIRTSLPGTYL
jgi:hypothetical protein